MDQWTSGSITAQGTKIHYYRTGGGKPPLVLLHGITDDGLCWSPAAEVLAEDYDVVMVDLRGHGKSNAPVDGYDYATMAAEAAGLITGLGLEKPVVMGHSMGAMTTLALGGLQPELPRALVLEDPPPFWLPQNDEARENRGRMSQWFEAIKRQTRDELLAGAREMSPDWSEAELQPWADAKHRFSLNITALLDTSRAIAPDFNARLGNITCPVLLITADPALGAIVTDESAAALQAYIPQLERVHLPGAGHNIRREQFSKYIEAVRAFLS